MRIRLLLVFLLLSVLKIYAQQRFIDFDNSVPANLSSSVSNQYTLSNEHVKGGANSLKWTPTNKASITLSTLNIPSTEIGNTTTGVAQLFIYSNKVSADTLVIKFYDNNNVVKREGHVLLNYKGWREYHRGYVADYGSATASFLLNKVELTYKAAVGSDNIIYLDEFRFVGNTETRNPGPHMALDIQDFRLVTNYTKAYSSWVNKPATLPITATSAEIAGIQTLKNTYKRTIRTFSSTDISAAKAYVDNLSIGRNTDGSIKGKAIADLYLLTNLLSISDNCGALAYSYFKTNDTDALNKLNLFVEFLIDQGLAEGGRCVTPYNDYTAARSFPLGFLEAATYITNPTVKTELIKMLRWSNEYNNIFNNSPVPGMEMDYLHVKSNFLIELALQNESLDETARDLKYFSRYLEQFTVVGQGARDGIKIDGVGFHHNSQHISYQYAYNTWIKRAFELKGTPFKISPLAYKNMVFAVKTLFLQTSKGAFYPNSASGRGPFPSSVPVTIPTLEQLIQVGGDIAGTAIEPDLAKFYNYITQTNKYAVDNVNLDGYYQLNYGQTGIMRKNNWVAVARGLTDKMFGSEIYAEANRYGRYQSYGALEVLYDGSLAATGYIAGGAGWDWNMMPGTTSVRQSYDKLKPLISGTATEYQGDAFAGSLADGNTGVFGINFTQNAGNKYTTSNLKFRKSVFTFDSVMVCLGSTISASNATDQVITTLFQGVNASSNPAIYINSATATSATYDQAVSTTAKGVWLVNAQTTGYYIPKGNGNVNIFRGSQTTPLHTTDNVNTTATANVSKAWLSHGVAPSAAKYQFVVVPATTPQKMTALSVKIDNEELYSILKQTDSVHAVKYIPENKIMYSCFLAQPNINVGFVKGISSRALLSVKEKGDSLIVKIANPDLNAVLDSESTWIATVSQVTVSLKGNWRVVQNLSNAGISRQENMLDANFSLKDGFSQTIVLVNDNLTTEEQSGIWKNQTQQWVYDLTTGTGLGSYGNPPTFQQGSATINGGYSHSMSTAGSPGFLPYPPSGTSRVHIVNSSGTSNGTIVLNPNGTLKMSASAVSGINKVSAYNIAAATPIASMFFTIAFNSSPTNGKFIWAIGNKGTPSNSFSNANSVYRETSEFFAALQWDITISGINLSFRESADTNGGVYKLITNSAFKKGENYDVEVYCNNSSETEIYTRNGESYELPAGKLNIWVRPHGKLVRASRLVYNSTTDIGASGEMASGVELNSYLFQGTESTLPTANAAEITLANMQMNHAVAASLPISMLSFNAVQNNTSVKLNWISASEKNTDYFTLYRSTDGLTFEEITTIKAAGNSTENIAYSFVDKNIPLNTSYVYYKLILTDKDGVLSYNNTISVKLTLENENAIQLFPNPVHQVANVSFIAKEQQTVKVTITDLTGRIILSQFNNALIGNNKLSIDVSSLSSGTYILRLEGKTITKQIKFLKL